MDDEQEVMKKRIVTSVVIMSLIVLVFASVGGKPDPDATVLYALRDGIVRCDSDERVSTKIGDRMALMTKADRESLAQHFIEQGQEVNENTVALIVLEQDKNLPTFFFVRRTSESPEPCVSNIFDVELTNDFYAALQKKYFMGVPQAANSGSAPTALEHAPERGD